MTTEERLLQFRVGVVVILAALIVGILIFLFGEGWTPQYSVVLRSKSAPGVTRNTPIRKNGILIGRVGRVETTDRGVILELYIKQGEKLFQDEIAQIGTESFLGDAVIDILPGTSEIRGAQIGHGEEMANVRVKPNPMEVVDVVIDLKGKVADAVDSVKRAGDTVDRAGQGITQVTQKIQESLDDENGDVKAILENVRRMTETADSTMVKLGSVLDKFDEFAGDEEFRNRLKETVKGLPEFFEDAKTTMADARQAIQKIKEVGESADVNLHNIEDFTRALGEEGPEIVERLKSSMSGIDRLVKNVDEFAQMLNSSDGSLARILKDPSLYENLNATLQNARDVSVKLKPLMNDLRVFADSLARDPGQLGVRGAMQRRPAGAGYKGTVFGETNESAW
jgi:phospholipid/cholesterol/gamma-HCH transport system substrate-binding protein